MQNSFFYPSAFDHSVKPISSNGFRQVYLHLEKREKSQPKES